MQLTDAQHSAIHNHEDNLIVVAGAGSGKTFVLVERYLALLDKHPEWALNSLVAITFTQKAAQEMRDRVRQHLQRQADETEGQTAERWANRLAAMDSARIDTIHGLCASILRGNAAEAGVDPGFEVLDEVEAGVLLDDAIDDVLRALKSDDRVLELFAEYGENGVRGLLNQTSKLQILAEFNPKTNDLFTEWLAQWVADSHKTIERFATFLKSSNPFNPIGVDALSDRWRVVGEVLGWFQPEAEQTERATLKDNVNQVETVASLSIPGRVHRDWGEFAEESKGEFTAIRDFAKKTLDDIGEPPGVLDLRAAKLIPLWAALATKVRDAYRSAKEERSALDFDDLEAMTAELLQDDAVRARYLNAAFKQVLVDEFQDTNAAQWAIIRRLADPDQPGCLFVVGDPKQSIYGFRGADVSVFEQVKGVITAQGVAVDLNRSFRTHRQLVECLNGLFERLLVRNEGSLARDYEVVFGGGMEAERVDAPSNAPVLELLLLDKEKLKDKEQSKQDGWGEEEGAARRWEARSVAARIKGMVEEERLIFDKRVQVIRPMDYGDVAMLFQAMTHVTLYEAALKAEGIPYLTIAGKGYYDRQEVWDLLNLLRALYNPLDNLSLAAALRSPLFSLSDDALLALRLITNETGETIALWEALNFAECVPVDEQALVEFARVTLGDLRRKAGRVTIAELLRLALEATGYLAVLTGLPDGKRRRGNVEKLIEKAETSGRITLGAFTEYLKDMSENEVREGEATLESEGVLQLMTVHKSKGLEFPLVVLVDASYERRGGGGDLVNGLACKVYDPESNSMKETYAYRRARTLDQLREMAERRRLLYVAATRAQDYLLVSGQVSYKENKGLSATGWLNWLIEALELSDVDTSNSLITEMVRVDFPERMLEADERDEAVRDEGSRDDWDAIGADESVESMPLLLQALPSNAGALTRSLTAAQIADLGSARNAHSSESRAYFAERWRQSVLHDAPDRITSIQRETGAAVAGVSEIVRRALRLPLPENDRDLRELLRRYAWEEGIVEEAQNRKTVLDAYELLKRVQRSEMFGWIESANEVYRELPFVYQTGRRTIHGIIDLLIQDKVGNWRLIDTKTAVVTHDPSLKALDEHAQRYHLQAGVYAAAVQELIGIAPKAYIYYIRYAKTVMIREAAWQTALSQLEETIRDVEHGQD